MNFLKKLFCKKNVVGGHEIIFNNKGFYNIKVGDKFEGTACGTWFSNQTCREVNGNYITGTTTLVIFTKEFIRPVGLSNNDEPRKIQF